MAKRIGELLSRLVPLSTHDIDEILHEQSSTRKPFGAIALSMGLCRPEHVWRAWCGQLDDVLPTVDLDTFGVDAQALSFVPAATAAQFSV
ncbi:MAG: hypothetical protein ACREJC_03080, partial [Tepidisphaeraceae bacterium]